MHIFVNFCSFYKTKNCYTYEVVGPRLAPLCCAYISHNAVGAARFRSCAVSGADWNPESGFGKWRGFAEKVTCFPTNTRRLSTKWRRSLVVKVQLIRPVRSEFTRNASTTHWRPLNRIDSGLGVCVSGPSAMPTVLCYILAKSSRSDRS